MNVDTLLHQYFPTSGNLCIEMFDEKNIQQVYRRLVEVLIHQPEIETSLLQGMSYCFYEVMDNVLIHSGKTVGIVITNYSEKDHIIQILVADDGMGIKASLSLNDNYANITEAQAIEYCIKDKVSDGKGLGFGLYSTSRLINTAGHRLIIRSGNHTLTANGDLNISESEPWQGTIVYFELHSNMDIDPASVVDHRTDPADEFDELFLDGDEELEKLW
ncbi:MAG: ATP-binding protein [Bacteroidales bacterium]|nr:ATP-binding protein [Bacteroidales bacterium]